MKQMLTDTEREFYAQIIGEQLGAVTFVQDYVQLAFDGPGITALTPITVVSDGLTVLSGHDQFRNKLCGQIAKIVKRVNVRDSDAFDIAFEDGSLISISLKPSDYVGSEALNFYGRDKQLVVI